MTVAIMKTDFSGSPWRMLFLYLYRAFCILGQLVEDVLSVVEIICKSVNICVWFVEKDFVFLPAYSLV